MASGPSIFWGAARLSCCLPVCRLRMGRRGSLCRKMHMRAILRRATLGGLALQLFPIGPIAVC